MPAFLAHQRAGGLAEGPRAELIGGVVEPPARLDPRETIILAHLESSLRAAVSARRQEALTGAERAAAAAALRVERFAAIRLGPSDLLRVDIAVFQPVGLAAVGSSNPSGTPGGSNDPSAAVLVVEVLRGRHSHELRLPLYAAAAVKELWLVDLGRGWTEVFRSPWQSRYRSRTLWYPGEAMPVQQLGAAQIEPLPRL